MDLILASNSPRRKELLAEAGYEFTVIPSTFEEMAAGLASDMVLANARGKAGEVKSRFPEALVLGADTVVALDGKVLGKPADAEAAKRMLRLLSGKTHSVFTGVCLIGKEEENAVIETRVKFFRLSESLIEEYVASGSPLDKAGAYGIQDGYPLVEKCEGSYTNVIGLPMETVTKLLERYR